MAEQRLVTFLLVEDDEDHAELAMIALRKARVVNAVDWVKDGVEALTYLRQEGEYRNKPVPDVILLDLKLPRKSGLEVLEEVRNDEALKNVPVVVLTTSGDARDIAEAYGHKVNSYLRKPVDFEQFQRMVGDLSFYWGVWNQGPTDGGK